MSVISVHVSFSLSLSGEVNVLISQWGHVLLRCDAPTYICRHSSKPYATGEELETPQQMLKSSTIEGVLELLVKEKIKFRHQQRSSSPPLQHQSRNARIRKPFHSLCAPGVSNSSFVSVRLVAFWTVRNLKRVRYCCLPSIQKLKGHLTLTLSFAHVFHSCSPPISFVLLTVPVEVTWLFRI